jgi:hypothetical protein
MSGTARDVDWRDVGTPRQQRIARHVVLCNEVRVARELRLEALVHRVRAHAFGRRLVSIRFEQAHAATESIEIRLTEHDSLGQGAKVASPFIFGTAPPFLWGIAEPALSTCSIICVATRGRHVDIPEASPAPTAKMITCRALRTKAGSGA